MERKLLYGEFFFVQIQTVKNPNPCPRLCCSLCDVLVACREIGSLSEQVKQKANLRDYNIQSRSSLCLKSGGSKTQVTGHCFTNAGTALTPPNTNLGSKY